MVKKGLSTHDERKFKPMKIMSNVIKAQMPYVCFISSSAWGSSYRERKIKIILNKINVLSSLATLLCYFQKILMNVKNLNNTLNAFFLYFKHWKINFMLALLL